MYSHTREQGAATQPPTAAVLSLSLFFFKWTGNTCHHTETNYRGRFEGRKRGWYWVDCSSGGEKDSARSSKTVFHSALPPSRRSWTAVAFRINQPENKTASYARFSGFFMDVEDLLRENQIPFWISVGRNKHFFVFLMYYRHLYFCIRVPLCKHLKSIDCVSMNLTCYEVHRLWVHWTMETRSIDRVRLTQS